MTATRRAVRSFFLVLVLATAGSGPFLAQPAASPAGRTATGRVVDAAGQPVADATLELKPTSGIIHSSREELEERLRRVRTEASGEFTLPGLAPGGYELLLHGQGLAPQVFPLDVPPGEGPWDFGPVKIRGAVLTGRVTDPAGRALAGAAVWLRRETDQLDGRWGHGPSTRTGADGTFAISGLMPSLDGGIGLDVCAAGFIPEEVELRTLPTEEIAIVLQPGGRITGRVVDPDGTPVAGAQIYTLRDGQSGGCVINDRPCDWDEDSTTSDAEGRFVLEPLLAATYTLRVHAPDLLPGDVEDVHAGPAETIEGLQITLQRGELLSGTVTGPGGTPVAGAAVSVADWWSQGVTGADGRYRLTAIPQGSWSIEIAAEGFEPAAVEMEILPGENRLDTRLDAEPPAPKPVLREIRGQVVDLGGRPVAGARVSAGRTRTLTDAAGVFSLRVLDGESYWVSAEKDGLESPLEDVQVDGAPVEGLKLRLLPEAALTVRVLGLEPEDLASLRVGTAWGDRFSSFASLGRDGTWRLAHLFPGTKTIRAETAGRWAAAEVTIAEGRREAVLDLRFPPVREVRGWVVDAEGRPLPRAAVLFRVGDDTLAAADTRADGSYTVRLEDGRYDIVVAGHSLRDDPEMVRVEIRGAPVDRLALVVED